MSRPSQIDTSYWFRPERATATVPQTGASNYWPRQGPKRYVWQRLNPGATVIVQPPAELRELLDRCGAPFGLTWTHLLAAGNTRPVVRSRWIAMMILKDRGMSLHEIVRYLCATRDHTNVLRGVRHGRALLESDPVFRAAWEKVQNADVCKT